MITRRGARFLATLTLLGGIGGVAGCAVVTTSHPVSAKPVGSVRSASTAEPKSQPPAGPVTPSVIGLSAAAAAKVAERDGFSFYVKGAMVAGGLPLGAVVSQSPPAGDPSSGPGPEIDVTLAVPNASACTAAQLAVDFRDGGAGAGNDFGGIVFRDVSAAPCKLAGTVSVTGIGAAGNADTRTIMARFTGPGVLSPHAPKVPAGAAPSPGELAYWWSLMAAYRDDPSASNGLCQPHWVIPVAWRVTLWRASTFTVPNADHGNAAGWDPTGSLITCQGNVTGAAPPAYWTS